MASHTQGVADLTARMEDIKKEIEEAKTVIPQSIAAAAPKLDDLRDAVDLGRSMAAQDLGDKVKANQQVVEQLTNLYQATRKERDQLVARMNTATQASIVLTREHEGQMQRAAQAVASNVQSVGELEAKILALNGLVGRELQRVDGNLSLIATKLGEDLGPAKVELERRLNESRIMGAKIEGHMHAEREKAAELENKLGEAHRMIGDLNQQIGVYEGANKRLQEELRVSRLEAISAAARPPAVDISADPSVVKAEPVGMEMMYAANSIYSGGQLVNNAEPVAVPQGAAEQVKWALGVASQGVAGQKVDALKPGPWYANGILSSLEPYDDSAPVLRKSRFQQAIKPDPGLPTGNIQERLVNAEVGRAQAQANNQQGGLESRLKEWEKEVIQNENEDDDSIFDPSVVGVHRVAEPIVAKKAPLPTLYGRRATEMEALRRLMGTTPTFYSTMSPEEAAREKLTMEQQYLQHITDAGMGPQVGAYIIKASRSNDPLERETALEMAQSYLSAEYYGTNGEEAAMQRFADLEAPTTSNYQSFALACSKMIGSAHMEEILSEMDKRYSEAKAFWARRLDGWDTEFLPTTDTLRQSAITSQSIHPYTEAMRQLDDLLAVHQPPARATQIAQYRRFMHQLNEHVILRCDQMLLQEENIPVPSGEALNLSRKGDALAEELVDPEVHVEDEDTLTPQIEHAEPADFSNSVPSSPPAPKPLRKVQRKVRGERPVVQQEKRSDANVAAIKEKRKEKVEDVRGTKDVIVIDSDSEGEEIPKNSANGNIDYSMGAGVHFQIPPHLQLDEENEVPHGFYNHQMGLLKGGAGEADAETGDVVKDISNYLAAHIVNKSLGQGQQGPWTGLGTSRTNTGIPGIPVGPKLAVQQREWWARNVPRIVQWYDFTQARPRPWVLNVSYDMPKQLMVQATPAKDYGITRQSVPPSKIPGPATATGKKKDVGIGTGNDDEPPVVGIIAQPPPAQGIPAQPFPAAAAATPPPAQGIPAQPFPAAAKPPRRSGRKQPVKASGVLNHTRQILRAYNDEQVGMHDIHDMVNDETLDPHQNAAAQDIVHYMRLHDDPRLAPVAGAGSNNLAVARKAMQEGGPLSYMMGGQSADYALGKRAWLQSGDGELLEKAKRRRQQEIAKASAPKLVHMSNMLNAMRH